MRAGLRRYGLCAALAGGVTLGLGLVMQSVAAAEFVPQPTDRIRFSPESYIYEEVIICRCIDEHWDWTQTVEPPPAIPRLPIEYARNFIIIIREPLEWVEEVQVDIGPTPLVRIPPQIPSRFLQGDVSGYCRVRFDVSPQGKPYNVTILLCTNSLLERPSIRSVQKWKYAPKIQNGRAVSRVGLETIIRFDLTDERGDLLPVPSGY